MLTLKEKWMLAGAWGLIVACGVIGMACLSGSEPQPARESFTLQPSFCGTVKISEEPLQRLRLWQEAFGPVRVPVTPYVGAIISEPICILPVGRETVTPVMLAVLPLYSGMVEMDRALLSWSLKKVPVNPDCEISKPQAILIHRQCDDGEIERIAVLDPKTTSYEDRDIRPECSYRYYVLVRGDEGVRSSYKPSTVRPVDKMGEGSVEGRVPAWTRVRLVGGDARNAILGVDSYNPQKARWESRIVRASPGQAIGDTGWTLERLRFDKFTLVAEATDERFQKREFSTKGD